MFDIHFMLTAAATVIGFANAMPPRHILRHLKEMSLRIAARNRRPEGKGRWQ